MFQSLLAAIAETLDKHGLSYMVIGGQAVLLYGEPRITKDIDITLGIGVDRLDDLLVAVDSSGWKVLVESPAEFARDTMVLPCEDPDSGIRLDFMFSFSPYEQQALERVNRVTIKGKQVAFTSIEDLIVHKIVAGRSRDLEDVRVVLTKNPNCDHDYVRRWLAQFEESFGEPIQKRFEDIVAETR